MEVFCLGNSRVLHKTSIVLVFLIFIASIDTEVFKKLNIVGVEKINAPIYLSSRLRSNNLGIEEPG